MSAFSAFVRRRSRRTSKERILARTPTISLLLRNAVYLSLITLLLPWILWRSLRTGRYRNGLRAKLLGCEKLSNKPESGKRIWLHGVSVGEIQLLGPLMDELRSSIGDLQFVVSTTTDTGMDLAQKLYGSHGDTQLIYFPLDLSWAVRRTIENVNADMLILGELEVWPNLLDIAAELRLPVVVVNGRLSPRSSKGYQRFAWLTRPMFTKLRLVVAQTPEYAERFVQCGVASDRVTVSGSFKFDNVSFDAKCPQVNDLKNLVGLREQHTVWVLGSSQDPEESTCCSALIKAKQQFPNLKLIIVPRHRERFEEVDQMIRTYPLRYLRRSGLQSHLDGSGLNGSGLDGDDWDVLLVDTIGELRWWWGLADLALVGSSFGSRNGQNMIEPAAYGANVAFGPKTLNFRAIVELLLQANAAKQIDSLDLIESWLMQQLDNPQAGEAQGLRAQDLVRSQQGAIARTVQQLVQILPNPQTKRLAA